MESFESQPDDVKRVIIEIGMHALQLSEELLTSNDNESIASEESTNDTQKESVEWERKYKKLEEENEEYRRKVGEEWAEKYRIQQSDFMEMLKEKDISYRNITQNVFDQVERRVKEKTEFLTNENLVLKERCEAEGLKAKGALLRVGELEKKYEAQRKGIEFENEIADHLKEVVHKSYNNMWTVEHIGHNLGSKGDIILTHKITKVRIMIDPKNHKNVGKVDKDKFLYDMGNEHNNFHGGLMVSRGSIQGKRTFEENIEGSRKLWYISNYVVGNEEFLMSLVEKMHDECVGKESDEGFTSEAIQMKYKSDYEDLKKELNMVDRHYKLLQERERKMVREYYDYFSMDLQVDNVVKNNIKVDKKTMIMNYLNDNVTYTAANTDVTHVHVIQEDIMKTMSDVSKRLITQYITEWKHMKDGKTNIKCTSRTKLTGYKYSAKKNEVVVIET